MQADYLVIGAGASGLAFTDTLVAGRPDAEVLVVDRGDGPGGHWRVAYPFVVLHSPSWFYGVDSAHLGQDRIDQDGLNKGLYERAGKTEILAYYDAVTEALAATGRVRFLFRHQYVDGVLRSTDTGQVVDLEVRTKVVDARYLEASVPATHQPSFEIAGDAAFVPVGMLPERAAEASRFVVLGSGKTAADACLWLLDQGTAPDRITWVRPRDAWWHDRAAYQGGALVADAIQGLATDAEAGREARSLGDFTARLEAAGNLVRLDPEAPAHMYRGGMLGAAEVDLLRTIAGVVRLGHVRRVERDLVLLSDGELRTGPDVLVVDCTARGLHDAPPRAIFTAGRIVLQQVRHNSPPFNAALIGWVEAHRDGDADKNRLCPPNPYARSIAEYPAMLARTWLTEGSWRTDADLVAWVTGSRLNLLRDLGTQQHDPRVRSGTGRFLTHVGGAIENLPRIATTG